MNYKFIINKYFDHRSGLEKSNPLLEIENQKDYGWYFVDEINYLSSNLDYIKEIVEKLETVLSGELQYYNGFGFEVYMIECDIKNAIVKNISENDQVEAIIPTQKVYELMRDWRDYLINYHQGML